MWVLVVGVDQRINSEFRSTNPYILLEVTDGVITCGFYTEDQ